MNGKKAKMLRRGSPEKLEKRVKKDYTSLNKFEKEFLSAFYKAKEKSKWGDYLSPSCAGCRNCLMKGKRNVRPE